jgi:hypothetical protein
MFLLLLYLRRMKWAGHVVRMDRKRKAYRVLVEKPEGKRSLERPMHRWEDNFYPIRSILGSYRNGMGGRRLDSSD